MKLLIVFNNQKPMTSKIADLVNWFGPELKIDSVITSFKNIPFTPVNSGKEVDKTWYNKNIVPLAKGYDMVLLSLPMKQWKGGSIRGRSVAGTPQRLQLGADSTGSYEYNDIKHPGGRWFNVARHEITHAWYKILKIQDNTHYWWELGKLEETLKEIKGQDLAKLKQLLIATKYLGVKEFVGKEHNPIILGWAKELNLPYYSDETPWCLKGETEILTGKGFIRLDELTDSGSIAQVSDNGEVSFTKNYIPIKKNYSGKAYEIDRLGITCDENHEFWGKWTGAGKFKKNQIKNLTKNGLSIPPMLSSQKDYSISDTELILLAAFLSDGNKSFNRINITVSKPHKIEILNKLPSVWNKKNTKIWGNRKITTKFSFRYPELFQEILTDYKRMSWEFILLLSARQCKLFIDYYSRFDGTISDGGAELFTADKELQNQLNAIAALAGYKSTPYSVKMVSKNSKIDYLYCVYISLNNKNRNIKPSNLNPIEYKGDLYCVSVPEGKIVVRGTNGVIFTIGNCSLFVNYVCMKAGLPYTNKLNARSWLDIGTKVTSPRPGDICIFWRNHPQSWEGHVGFYMVGDDKNIGVLGGNQGNMVSTQFYKASQLLGYRRLT